MESVKKYLREKNIAHENVGARSSDEKLTLQDMIPAVVKAMRAEDDAMAIVSCGTGVGVEIAANRFKGIRATLATSATTAKNARIYDDANVLCLSAWDTTSLTDILDAWFDSQYDGSEKRRAMFAAFDSWVEN